jgi:PUA domain protein
MAPGITDADIGIQNDDLVWVCDERHKKPLAVGIAMMTGEEMKTKKPGKAIKILHYVGDRLWVLTHQ